VSTTAVAGKAIRSTIPARLDRLSWSKFHTRMVIGLGSAWILDGLQITIASSVTGVLTQPDTLDMTSTQVGLIASVYLVGEVIGALVFGRLSDQLGRKRLLIYTLLLYLCGTGLAAFTVNDGGWLWLAYFYTTRLIAGMGIGGQYAAINSAIDEMMPSKYRGRVDIWINGSYWAGAILGSFASLVFLNAFAPDVGWRLAFLLGPVLALVIIFVGRTLPESPRWLMTHGRIEEAEKEMAWIEEVAGRGRELEPVDDLQALELVPEERYGYVRFLGLVFRRYPKRAVLGATLMITQSFLYNAIYFTYGLVLVKFYGVSADMVPLYGLAFAVGNLCGPLVLGPLFDTVGRKPMIAGTYLISGVLLAISGLLFQEGHLDAVTQTFVWVVIFFFASAGASAAYLTVSETWPIEIRAEAIAVFFAIAQIFGAFGPAFYGALIGDGTSTTGLFVGYVIGGGIMIVGGIIELIFGINAEGKSLEAVTKPLTATNGQVAAEPAPATA
jgi:MFS family permease